MPRRWAVHATVLLVAIATGRASAQPLAFTRQDVASYPGARGLVAADFDRDGWLDLAQANTGRNTVTILINQRGSARSFVAAYDVAVGLGPFDLTTADFNRDGVPDLAVANADAHTISILRGQAAGGFIRNDIAAPSGPRGITTADLNRDGRADLVVTGWDVNALQVLYGTGTGAFTNGPALSGLPTHPQGVVTARLQSRRASRRRRGKRELDRSDRDDGNRDRLHTVARVRRIQPQRPRHRRPQPRRLGRRRRRVFERQPRRDLSRQPFRPSLQSFLLHRRVAAGRRHQRHRLRRHGRTSSPRTAPVIR